MCIFVGSFEGTLYPPLGKIVDKLQLSLYKFTKKQLENYRLAIDWLMMVKRI